MCFRWVQVKYRLSGWYYSGAQSFSRRICSFLEYESPKMLNTIENHTILARILNPIRAQPFPKKTHTRKQSHGKFYTFNCKRWTNFFLRRGVRVPGTYETSVFTSWHRSPYFTCRHPWIGGIRAIPAYSKILKCYQSWGDVNDFQLTSTTTLMRNA